MKPLSFLFLLPVLLCLFGAAASATGGDAPALHRGVNLSSWLANAPRQPLFTRDFILLKEAGFDHVRLPFNPEYYGFKLDGAHGPGSVDYAELDRAIGLAIGNGLAVVLDVHPNSEFMATLEKQPQTEAQFIALWQALARRYEDRPANMLAYSLLNEPQYYHSETRYAAFARRLEAAVRSVDTKHLIIIGAPRGSSIEGLLTVEPVADPHIAYDFHFYEPYIVTHQGIHSGFEGTMIPFFRHVPYPSALVRGAAAAYAEKPPDPAQAQSELDEYTQTGWNEEHIAQRIAVAARWAQSHHVRILCGEFGVLRERIDPASRYRWIGDVRKALEANAIGWELWDYTDGFGIAQMHGKTATDPDGAVKFIDPSKGSRTIEPQAYSALGLK